MAETTSSNAFWDNMANILGFANAGVDIYNKATGKSEELANSVNPNQTSGTYTTEDVTKAKMNTALIIGGSVAGFLVLLFIMRKVL